MVHREDIEAKAKEIEDSLRSTKETVKTSLTWSVVAVLIVVAVAYLLGRKKGKAGGAVVEVYRVK